MRVNVYAEEMTDRVEVIEKKTAEGTFTGVRFYLELPATVRGELGTLQARGPFLHRPGDDDSAAVTFWGKQDLRKALHLALDALDRHEQSRNRPEPRRDAGCDTMTAMLVNCRMGDEEMKLRDPYSIQKQYWASGRKNSFHSGSHPLTEYKCDNTRCWCHFVVWSE